ncbi:hypothetical protein MYX76_17860, partial [Desulfobacterota bacterium AH_259_B03_O07]|nr:hypothetical protein [Desulfobacterota bacterium AH_259_B03_O07]
IGAGSASTIIERDSGPSVSFFNFFIVTPSGELNLDSLTVKGGRSATTGGGAIRTRGKLTITNSIISDNFADGFGGAINNGSFFFTAGAGPGILNITNSIIRDNFSIGPGGAISSEEGAITITGSTFSGNFADSSGGAIRISDENLTISDSVITGNSADGGGGGIDIEVEESPGVVVINNCTISNNSATHHRGDGGGILKRGGTMLITGSTISNNTAGEQGGGIRNIFSDITIINGTISGNSAGDGGGGIYNDPFGIETPDLATVDLNNVTIAFNTADSDGDGVGDGGGIFNAIGGTINFSNTIIAGNSDTTSDPDCFGELDSFGFNLIQTVSQDCPIVGDTTGNLIGVNPLLGSLTNNGGSTETHALSPNSP